MWHSLNTGAQTSPHFPVNTAALNKDAQSTHPLFQRMQQLAQRNSIPQVGLTHAVQLSIILDGLNMRCVYMSKRCVHEQKTEFAAV